LGWTAEELQQAFEAGHRCSKPESIVLGKATGVVRVSLGMHNSESDVRLFILFIARTFLMGHESIAYGMPNNPLSIFVSYRTGSGSQLTYRKCVRWYSQKLVRKTGELLIPCMGIANRRVRLLECLHCHTAIQRSISIRSRGDDTQLSFVRVVRMARNTHRA
ncbi:hypothetical protein KCU89_g41, partial [Aureobasidium melanogenum]